MDTNHLLIRGMDMGRINNIIQRHVDEHIEQKDGPFNRAGGKPRKNPPGTEI